MLAFAVASVEIALPDNLVRRQRAHYDRGRAETRRSTQIRRRGATIHGRG